MSRLETFFGDNGMSPGSEPVQGRMRAFGARYRFAGRTWGLVVWAHNWSDATEYARQHGLTIDGRIESVHEA